VTIAQFAGIFIAFYLLFCVLAGLAGSRRRLQPVDFFISNRTESTVTSALSITIVSVAAVGVFHHLGLIYRDGLSYAIVSLFVIVIPLTGVFLLARQWIISKRFGYVTPAEMLSGYYLSRTIRLLVAFVALIFAVPFVATQFVLAGVIVEYCFGGRISSSVGIVAFALTMLGYMFVGGSRTISLMSAFQFIIVLVGMLLASLFVLEELGGFDRLIERLADLGRRPDSSGWGRTGDGHNPYLSIPGVFSQISGSPGAVDTGGPWSAVMLATYLLSFAGIQAAPAISMSAYGSRTTASVALQSMLFVPVFAGVAVVLGLTIVGLGSNFLHGPPASPFTHLVTADGMKFSDFDSVVIGAGLATTLSSCPSWLVAILGVCAIALLHAASATFIACGAAIVTRDVIKAYLLPSLSHNGQILSAKLLTGLFVLLAIALALLAPEVAGRVGKLAPSLSLQLVPALVGVCWLQWISRRGVLAGLGAGVLMVFMTDEVGVDLVNALSGAALPWHHWPLSIHPACWGIVVNLLLVLLVSAGWRRESTSRHRERIHRYLNDYARRIPRRARRVPNAWIGIIIWLLFAAGPGLVLGNRVFGDPAAGAEGWRLAVPSIWAWQIVWWLCGIAILWYIGYVMRLVRRPKNPVKSLVDDATDVRAHS